MEKELTELVENKKEELEENLKECKKTIEDTVQKLESQSAEDILKRETSVQNEDKIDAELEALDKVLHIK